MRGCFFRAQYSYIACVHIVFIVVPNLRGAAVRRAPQILLHILLSFALICLILFEFLFA